MPDGGTPPARSADARPVRKRPRHAIRVAFHRLDRLTLRRAAYSVATLWFNGLFYRRTLGGRYGRGLVHAPQEVRVAKTTPFEEHGLIDDVRAAAHPLDGGLASTHELFFPRQRLVTWDRDDGQAVSVQLREETLLVLDPPLFYPVEHGIRAHRSPQVPVDRGSFQMCKVSALQRTDDIAGGVHQLGIDPLHWLPLLHSRSPSHELGCAMSQTELIAATTRRPPGWSMLRRAA